MRVARTRRRSSFSASEFTRPRRSIASGRRRCSSNMTTRKTEAANTGPDRPRRSHGASSRAQRSCGAHVGIVKCERCANDFACRRPARGVRQRETRAAQRMLSALKSDGEKTTRAPVPHGSRANVRVHERGLTRRRRAYRPADSFSSLRKNLAAVRAFSEPAEAHRSLICRRSVSTRARRADSNSRRSRRARGARRRVSTGAQARVPPRGGQGSSTWTRSCRRARRHR